jgi:hypothetical protein
MKWEQTIKILTVLAALAIPVQLRLAAQDQQPPQSPQQSQPPQQKPEPPRFSLATANYNFLIASAFLCDPSDSTTCPAVARAANGETVELSGAGTLGAANKSVTAAGAFTVKSPNGYIITTGIWTATGLESFESYGIAPGALLRDYPQFRTLGAFPGKGGLMEPGLMMAGPMAGSVPGPMAGPMGLMASPMGLMGGPFTGPLAAGGLAVIRIRLLPDAGSPTDAVLRVNCAKGKVPEDRPGDGVRLAITGGPEFDEPLGGRTVFLLLRPGPNFARKNAQKQ